MMLSIIGHICPISQDWSGSKPTFEWRKPTKTAGICLLLLATVPHKTRSCPTLVCWDPDHLKHLIKRSALHKNSSLTNSSGLPVSSSLTAESSAQTDPDEDGVVVLCGKDVVPSGPPHVHAHLVFEGQLDHAADAGHLATFLRQRGVIQRHNLLFIFVYGTPPTAVHRRMHGEVIEALPGAAEDACVADVAPSLVEQHSVELQDSGTARVAVADVQLGCEGHRAWKNQTDKCNLFKKQKAMGVEGQENWMFVSFL